MNSDKTSVAIRRERERQARSSETAKKRERRLARPAQRKIQGTQEQQEVKVTN